MLKVTSRRVFIGALVACGLYWASFWSEEWMKLRWRAVYASSQRPPVVDGLRFRFSPFLNREPEPATSGQSTTVLVFSDECSFSRAQADDWLAVMKLPEADRLKDVILVRTGIGRQIETSLLAELQNGTRRVQSLNVTDNVTFMETTGVAWTPATIVIDADRRVRFLAERLSVKSPEQVRRFIESSPIH